MQPLHMTETQARVQVNSFVRSVYNWMAVGLGVTGLVALFVANSETMLRLIFGNRMMIWILFAGELGLVFYLSSRVQRISSSAATGLFLLYSALNGLTLSFIFIAYARATIASTFFVCAATFLTVSIFGWTTKRDLTGMGNFLFMGLIGIIIATLINMFIQSSGMQMIISYVGVLVFVGLTAYDTQQIKRMALTQPADIGAGAVRKGAILGALKLYLDFINLFLMLLHILGGRD